MLGTRQSNFAGVSFKSPEDAALDAREMQNGNVDHQKGNAVAPEGELPKKTLIEFETPQPPTLVATSPYQMTLQWKKLLLRSPPQEPELDGLAINFALLMKLVGPSCPTLLLEQLQLKAQP